MENASKALIIAGAILLSILLISLGIMIFNQAQDTLQNSGMSQAEVNAFNNQFLKYEGKLKKGSMIKSLIQEVNANNAQDESAERQISIVSSNDAKKVTLSAQTANNVTTYLTSAIVSTKTYDVEITEYASDGRIKTIKITLSK